MAIKLPKGRPAARKVTIVARPVKVVRRKSPVQTLAKAVPVPEQPVVPAKGKPPTIKPFRGNPPRIPGD